MPKITTQDLNGGDYCAMFCLHCDRLVAPGKVVGLELDTRIDQYHDFGGIPTEFKGKAQGFGPDCAKTLRAKAKAALIAKGLVEQYGVQAHGK